MTARDDGWAREARREARELAMLISGDVNGADNIAAALLRACERGREEEREACESVVLALKEWDDLITPEEAAEAIRARGEQEPSP